MRQVFTSLRVETVEGVARLLQDAGIEVHIANGRSYHSKRGSQFSFVEPMSVKQQPSLWVKKAEDQPRARELLREAGLLASTRPGQGDPLLFAPTPTTDEPKKRALAWPPTMLLYAPPSVQFKPRPKPKRPFCTPSPSSAIVLVPSVLVLPKKLSATV